MNTADQVIAIIAEQAFLEPEDVTLDSTLESLGIDSMGVVESIFCLLYTSPSTRDQRGSRMPSSA